MKKIYFLFIFLVLLAGCKSTKPLSINQQVSSAQQPSEEAEPKEINFHDQTTWILGYFQPGRLSAYPNSTWYLKGYDDYQPETEAINNLFDISKDDITMKVVMGIWCSDSRREVPRFMKVIDTWHFPVDKITFIGVDDDKQSPVGEYTSLDIVRVPTFIIFKNNIEAGRIIENPTTSLEQDLVNILTGMKKQ